MTYRHGDAGTATVRDHWWWRPGWRFGRRVYTFHIIFENEGLVAGVADLRRLAAKYQRRLAALPGLDLVPRRWLHLTMQNVGLTDDVSDTDCEAVVDRARAAYSELAPFDLTFDAVEVRREAIAFRPWPAEPVKRLREASRVAISVVLGEVPEAPEHAHGFQPHVTLAYSNAAGPAEPLLAAVRDVDEAPATVWVRAACLIVLDRDERIYRWTTRATIPLGSSAGY
jgi:2'-5' RNA ligase